MTYLDHGATSYPKPPCVLQAVTGALRRCANPGRGGYRAAVEAMQTVYRCRETAAQLFDCQPEQVAFTANATQGLNIAIRSLLKPGGRAVISGFEHNAVTRPLTLLNARIRIAGRRLFDQQDTLERFEDGLRAGADGAVFTYVSNVFGYILPVEELAALCRGYGVPFLIDASQAAGYLPVRLGALGADYIAMPGHKGLLGPQGTGLLLCGDLPAPLLAGGTGSESASWQMPEFLPDRVEPGTLNVPGIAGLGAGMEYLRSIGIETAFQRAHRAMRRCVRDLERLGYPCISGERQAATVSFVPKADCEVFAARLAQRNVAVRAGLHCAPLAHESAGTLKTGTVRVSFGHDANAGQNRRFLQALEELTDIS